MSICWISVVVCRFGTEHGAPEQQEFPYFLFMEAPAMQFQTTDIQTQISLMLRSILSWRSINEERASPSPACGRTVAIPDSTRTSRSII